MQGFLFLKSSREVFICQMSGQSWSSFDDLYRKKSLSNLHSAIEPFGIVFLVHWSLKLCMQNRYTDTNVLNAFYFFHMNVCKVCLFECRNVVANQRFACQPQWWGVQLQKCITMLWYGLLDNLDLSVRIWHCNFSLSLMMIHVFIIYSTWMLLNLSRLIYLYISAKLWLRTQSFEHGDGRQ